MRSIRKTVRVAAVAAALGLALAACSSQGGAQEETGGGGGTGHSDPGPRRAPAQVYRLVCASFSPHRELPVKFQPFVAPAVSPSMMKRCPNA